MFESIKRDLQYQFQSGNTLTRIILVNIAIFVFIKLIYVFTAYGDVNGIYSKIVDVLSLHSGAPKVYTYPWTWLTHMFLHEGTWHLIWNMVLLYWFGRIVGDFLGDRRILPLYILGGLVGAAVYVLADYIMPFGSDGNVMASAMGASAAVMTMLMTAAMLSPDYELHLLLIGPVKIKWVALVILFFDLVGTAGTLNTGGHYAHLGGALFGILYVNRLHNGTDLAAGLQSFIDKISKFRNPSQPIVKKKAAMQVVYNKGKVDTNVPEIEHVEELDFQSQLDYILDKINEQGFQKLSKEEKEFLAQASKKD